MHELNPNLGQVLSTWEWHGEVFVGLILVGLLFTRGWWRLRQRDESLAAGWRLALYWGGILVLGLAILSPVQVLTHDLFFMHMVQHLMFTILAPVLLLSTNPIPFMLWGLPDGVRRWLGELLRPDTRLGRLAHRLTSPGVAWMLFVAILLGWHDPRIYDAALSNTLLHPVEHLSFFGTALLFWWHVSGTSPHTRRMPRGARLAFLVVTTIPVMGMGMFIAASGMPLYSHYTLEPRMWGVTPLQDQQWGGMIMFMTGGLMFILGGLIFVAQMLRAAEDEAPAQSALSWEVDEVV